MHVLVRGAAATGLLAAISALLSPLSADDLRSGAGRQSEANGAPSSTAASAMAPSTSAPLDAASTAKPCPARQLPAAEPPARQGGCVAVPAATAPLRSSRLDRLAAEQSRMAPLHLGGHEGGIPRLPDRPERYEAYELPVQGAGLVSPASPMDLAGDELERWLRGEGRSPPGPTGIRIESSPNAAVTLVDLERQQGDAEVLLAGELYGVTVAVRHRVDTGAGVRDYIALYGQLSRPGPDLTPGAMLGRGAVIGFVGDRNGSDSPHLYFELRQLRLATRAAGVSGKTLSEIVRPAVSLPCDPRNVLPLR